MSSINKKLGILRLEQVALKEEMKQNDELGTLLMRKLEKVAQHNEIDKFKTHVEELEKITYLMISLSGRLARAENALLILPPNAPLEEKVCCLNYYFQVMFHSPGLCFYFRLIIFLKCPPILLFYIFIFFSFSYIY